MPSATRLADSADAIAFGEKLLALLDQGRFTSTYKYAVIVGLLDACRERTSLDGRAPDFVTTGHLAERVAALYWPHTQPYEGSCSSRVLFQNPSRGRGKPTQAEIVAAITRFRSASADPSSPLFRAREADPGSYAKLVRDIEWKLIEMPLPKLQRFNATEDPFIYQIGWNDNVKRRQTENPSFDRRIRFVGAAGEHLLTLAGLLRPLLHREWASLVAALNDDIVEAAELEDHLFGADRISLEAVRQPLMDLQHGRCFYCDGRVTGKVAPAVDHFLPWSRTANDCLENLVVADAACNRSKSNFLAASASLEPWLLRLTEGHAALAGIGRTVRWPLDAGRTLSEARSLYLRLRTGVHLWGSRADFVPPNLDRLHALFATRVVASRAAAVEAPAVAIALSPGLARKSDRRTAPGPRWVRCYPDLVVAAGALDHAGAVDEGSGEWVRLPAGVTASPERFVARVLGTSMNRVVGDGAWAVFRTARGGSHTGRVVLVRFAGCADPDLGAYTLKRYVESRKCEFSDRTWEHERIVLRPESDDPRHQAPMVLEHIPPGDFQVLAEFVATVE